MPSPLGGWTAKSLLPQVTHGSLYSGGAAAPPANATPLNTQGTPSWLNVLASVLGPSNISTALRPQGPLGNPSAAISNPGYEQMAQAYAQNLAMRNQMMSAQNNILNQIYNTNNSAASLVGPLGVGPSDLASYRARTSQANTLESALPQVTQLASAAASAPVFAPQQQSFSTQPQQQNTNPMSGWVSPASAFPNARPAYGSRNAANTFAGLI